MTKLQKNYRAVEAKAEGVAGHYVLLAIIVALIVGAIVDHII